jgi:trehalose 6-phosphate phosphatase
MTLHDNDGPWQQLALFLDVDGTLLKIAATPDTVQVPKALRNTLELAAAREQGALALISGRSLNSLDRLFAPSQFPAAGQHGAERRDSQGRLWRAQIDTTVLNDIRAVLQPLVAACSGLLLEDKGRGFALHYRNAPELQMVVYAEMTKLQQRFAHHLQLKPGKHVLELSPTQCSKGTAIKAFMTEAPFAGRTPVFVGDDVTDEDGFAAVNELGGCSIRVGDASETVARYRFGNVSAVIDWLREPRLIAPYPCQ